MIQILQEKLRKYYPHSLISITIDFNNFSSGRSEVEWTLSIQGAYSGVFPTWGALLAYSEGLIKNAKENIVNSELVVMSSMSAKEE